MSESTLAETRFLLLDAVTEKLEGSIHNDQQKRDVVEKFVIAIHTNPL